MTTKEAAEFIGIQPSTVRALVAQGKLKAKRVPLPGTNRYYYDINAQSAKQYRDNPTDSRGWVRGRSRKS